VEATLNIHRDYLTWPIAAYAVIITLLLIFRWIRKKVRRPRQGLEGESHAAPTLTEQKVIDQLKDHSLCSLDWAYSEAQRRLDMQLDQVDGLDTKASILLGFEGVILAMTLGWAKDAQASDPWYLLVCGALASAATFCAAALAVIAYWPRDYKVAPRVGTARGKLIDWKEKNSKYVTLSQLQRCIEENDRTLAEKARFLKLSLVSLSLGLACVSCAIVANVVH